MDKQALKQLLNTSRARIAPETHGLTRPTGPGRRTPGLSQHQIDQILNWSIGTYRHLEAGHNDNPTFDLLRGIARLFGYNEQEWTTLCRLARGESPPGPLYDTAGNAVPSAWDDVVKAVASPAYVTDASWNLLTCNAQFHALFDGGQAPANTMRWMLLDGRDQLTDWENAWAPFVMPQLDHALSLRPDDQVLSRIRDEVLADPVARSIYTAGGTSIHPDGDERPIRHAVEKQGWVTMCVAEPLAAPGSRFMVLIFRPGERRTTARPPMLEARSTG
ncbi:helix-turn-helix domain-containing protein [Streptomyces sp. NPDC029006]|uniref:MmyB family transcriptional regulator n=1 Tax=Streptomyces sp. NPDC029006 TaxID=3155467 RepID=UPI0033F6341D